MNQQQLFKMWSALQDLLLTTSVDNNPILYKFQLNRIEQQVGIDVTSAWTKAYLSR